MSNTVLHLVVLDAEGSELGRWYSTSLAMARQRARYMAATHGIAAVEVRLESGALVYRVEASKGNDK